jgi:hypothetical protein
MNEDYGQCSICKDTYTMQHVEAAPNTYIFVCSECIEIAEDNFIWLCLTCGKTYIRQKALVINKIKDLELKKAYMLCEDMLIIQGIDVCIACSPERILDYAEMDESALEC